MEFATILLFGLLLAGVIENMLYQRALRRIPLRILVNGTRGKTTVARMTAAVLGEAGIRTYAKTTGSQARWILPDGSEKDYRRKSAPPNMMEQLPFVRLAVRGNAQAIVVECMAQRAENQRFVGDRLLQPTHILMTNAYVDHVEEIGSTEEETVEVLCQSITQKSVIIAHDPRFDQYGKAMIPVFPDVPCGVFEACPFPVHQENVSLVFTFAQSLGISPDTVIRGLQATRPDIGMIKEVRLDGCLVRNAFAANDPVSFLAVLREYAICGPYVLLYNHREDRAYRLKAFAMAVQKAEKLPGKIAVIGDNKAWCAHFWRRQTGISAEAVANPLTWIRQVQGQVLCAGNIRGEGILLLEQLIREAQKNV